MRNNQPGQKQLELTQRLSPGLTLEQQHQLVCYIQHLVKWNKVFNLSAIRDVDAILSHHILDSLAIGPFLKGEMIADIGTGAGLPGIPLAIAFPHKNFLLVDSNGKKTRFLQQIKHELALENVKVENQRVENLTQKQDSIISRAFASLNDMIKESAHLLDTGGFFQAMKGKAPHQELKRLPDTVVLVSLQPVVVPGLFAERHLVNLKKIN